MCSRLMTDDRTTHTATAPTSATRIDQFLTRRGLTRAAPTVVPLTGDASDRRYFRVLLRDEPTQVLAVHPGPIDFDALPFVNVARLLSAMPVPVPRDPGHSDALGIIALEDLGDVTLQAHLGAASPAEHAALYRQAVSLIETLQRRGARARVAGLRAVRHRVRRREADVGAAVLHEALPRGAIAAPR